ncbi:MAG: TrmH family RNA methyltransferase [Negativicutes bacterium]
MNRRIVSPDNQYIKLTASLRQKKYREETGLFVVEGTRFVQEALESSWVVEYAVVSEAHEGNERIRELATNLERRECPVLSISPALYKKISDTETPQGILAVMQQKRESLDEVIATASKSLWVILDSLQDPGNVGTIIRTADAACAAGVVLAGECADLYAGKTTRATMGSLFHLPVLKASATQCLEFCDRLGLSLYVAGAEAEDMYTVADLTAPCAVVLGNEGAGVGDDFRRQAQLHLKIPIAGRAESLNVASAAAVIIFEAVRQRGLAL